jgi:hypothetical protein
LASFGQGKNGLYIILTSSTANAVPLPLQGEGMGFIFATKMINPFTLHKRKGVFRERNDIMIL